MIPQNDLNTIVPKIEHRHIGSLTKQLIVVGLKIQIHDLIIWKIQTTAIIGI